jgi:hypothetical protein
MECIDEFVSYSNINDPNTWFAVCRCTGIYVFVLESRNNASSICRIKDRRVYEKLIHLLNNQRNTRRDSDEESDKHFQWCSASYGIFDMGFGWLTCRMEHWQRLTRVEQHSDDDMSDHDMSEHERPNCGVEPENIKALLDDLTWPRYDKQEYSDLQEPSPSSLRYMTGLVERWIRGKFDRDSTFEERQEIIREKKRFKKYGRGVSPKRDTVEYTPCPYCHCNTMILGTCRNKLTDCNEKADIIT